MRLSTIRRQAIARLQNVPGVQRVAVRLGGRPMLRVDVDPFADVGRVHAALGEIEDQAEVDVVRNDARSAAILAE